MEQNKDQSGAAVRGEAVAICPECGDVALCPRCDAAPVMIALTDAQIGNFWMARDCIEAIRAGDVVAQFVSAFRAGMKSLGVWARAADAPSEPSELLYQFRARALPGRGLPEWTGWELCCKGAHDELALNADYQVRSFGLIKSRAADALDSQPTEPWTRTEDRLPPVETPVFILHSDDVKIGEIRWENPAHEETFEAFMYWDDPNDDGQSWNWLEVTHWMPIPPAPASNQPTESKGE